MVQCWNGLKFNLRFWYKLHNRFLHVRAKTNAVGVFCFYHTVKRVYKVARRNKLRMTKPNSFHNNQAWNNSNILNRVQCSIRNNHLVTHKKKDCYSVFQIRPLFCAAFGVTKEYMYIEAFTAMRKMILQHQMIKLKNEGNQMKTASWLKDTKYRLAWREHIH